MGTTTPNLGLYKPAAGETGWGTLVDGNFDTLDKGPFLSTQLVRYVDYVNGSDSNSGLSPGSAKKTIQSAYDNLVTVAGATYTPTATGMGVGTIYLLPGFHDVGTGVVIGKDNPVQIKGTRSGWGRPQASNSESVVVSSSAALTSFFTLGGVGVHYGSVFKDVAFLVDTAVISSFASCILSYGCDYLRVENCSADTVNGTTQLTSFFVDQAPATSGIDDNAWTRLINNQVARMGLYKARTGTNFNRSVIERNVCFYQGANPMIHLQGDFRGGSVSNNNIEGSSTGIKCDSNTCDFNVFINNSGEYPQDGLGPAYDFTAGQNNNVLFGGHILGKSGVTGVWAQFAATAIDNIVIKPDATYTGVSGRLSKIVDSTGKNILINGAGALVRYKTGTAPSISDGDFNTVENGAMAVTYGSTGPVYKMWLRANGTWQSVALT